MSDDDADDFIAFGKALKPLEDDAIIRKKPIAVEEQIVRDENGIRRFHGAFTGGWSAGHFNTVNTPQGWTPSQFKSSRADKGDRGGQRPEDFMDEEDRGAFGFAAEALKTKSGFQGGEGGGGSSVLGSASGAFLEQLVKPVQGTVGERLLQAQGWKPGQGIGPKLTRQARNKRRGKGDKEKEKDDPMLEKYKDFLFAPDETPIAVARPKDNFFGIGYSGLARGTGAPLVHGSSDYKVSFGGGGKKGMMKKFSITGEAFGIGADEEDDDLSVYNQGGLAEYDFSLDVSGKEERREKRSKEQSRWGAPTTAEMSANFLEGFKLARSQSLLKKRYAPPQIPHNWTPKGRPSKKRSRWDAGGDQGEARAQGVPHSQSRGGTNPSVEQRRSVLFPDQANREVKVEEPLLPVKLPDFLLKGEIKSDGAFKPFARNPEKQKRYDQYRVCLENNSPEVLRSLQPRSMTEWEREKEKLEFERASMLFQPMKGVIGSRFVSAGDSVTVDEGGGTGEVVKKDGGVEAAAIGMFGALTRTKEEWHPARLLCVRFNVAHPYSDTSTTGTAKPAKRDTGVTNVFAALENVQEVPVEQSEKSDTDKNGEDAPEKPTDEIKAEQEEAEEEVIVPKPPMDLFKAIFADSSDDESEKEEEDREETAAETAARLRESHATSEKIKGPANPWEERKGNVLRSKEPAKGIFANIDFETLNKRTSSKRPRSPSNSPPRESNELVNKSKEGSSSSSDEGFGPALPPGLKSDVKVEKEVTNITLSSDSDGYKKKKSKKRKKEKKKKHKENKKHRSSEDAVIVLSDSEEDGLMSILKSETNWSEKKKKTKKEKKHKSR